MREHAQRRRRRPASSSPPSSASRRSRWPRRSPASSPLASQARMGPITGSSRAGRVRIPMLRRFASYVTPIGVPCPRPVPTAPPPPTSPSSRSRSSAVSRGPATSRSRSSTAASATPTSTPPAASGAQTEWPIVPGHEIVGRVSAVGAEVEGFAVGDLAGVGCMVDSCRECASCAEGLEQYCENGPHGLHLRRGRESDREDDRRAATRARSSSTRTSSSACPTDVDLAGDRAAPLRRHHHLLAAAPLERRPGLEGRRRRPRRPRPHGA